MIRKKTIGITGASGALGKSLTKIFQSKGYEVIGFTHKKKIKTLNTDAPDKWVYWESGKESLLEKNLKNIDILILNHGIYAKTTNNLDYENSLYINAISKLKIFDLFKEIALKENKQNLQKEIWINTSEAELLPALNPTYEISKSLIGNIVTFKKNFLTDKESKKLIIKKIILGPFKSELNPIGIMSPNFVAFLIFYISKIKSPLIIISPNPLSYILFPLKEFYFVIYCKFLKFLKILN
tara:strand:- start:1551 stop:2267 length:717 start_codon:yes stop_codon:yes gene_type:complete